jgi:hypothetical protein
LQPNCRSRSFRVYFSRLPLANPNLHHTVSHLTSPTDDLPPLPLPRLDQDPTLRNSPTGANHAVILDRTRELDLALSLASQALCAILRRVRKAGFGVCALKCDIFTCSHSPRARDLPRDVAQPRLWTALPEAYEP